MGKAAYPSVGCSPEPIRMYLGAGHLRVISDSQEGGEGSSSSCSGCNPTVKLLVLLELRSQRGALPLGQFLGWMWTLL